MSTFPTIAPAPASAARGYGEFIQGLSRDGVVLRAAVFNEREVRVAAGLTMTLAAVALAYAVPSIASDVEGLRPYLTHEVTGLRVPPGFVVRPAAAGIQAVPQLLLGFYVQCA